MLSLPGRHVASCTADVAVHSGVATFAGAGRAVDQRRIAVGSGIGAFVGGIAPVMRGQLTVDGRLSPSLRGTVENLGRDTPIIERLKLHRISLGREVSLVSVLVTSVCRVISLVSILVATLCGVISLVSILVTSVCHLISTLADMVASICGMITLSRSATVLRARRVLTVASLVRIRLINHPDS
jgi:hypothetical protein